MYEKNLIAENKSNDEEEYAFAMLYREHSGEPPQAKSNVRGRAERNGAESAEHGLRAAHRASGQMAGL